METSNMQALVDGLNAQWQKDRATTQMTLGDLISRLESMPADKLIHGLRDPHSYRGYYCDIALEPSSSRVFASDLLRECRESMGKCFTGYKGGDFMMGEATPVWIASYGCCGDKLVRVNDDGSVDTE